MTGLEQQEARQVLRLEHELQELRDRDRPQSARAQHVRMQELQHDKTELQEELTRTKREFERQKQSFCNKQDEETTLKKLEEAQSRARKLVEENSRLKVELFEKASSEEKSQLEASATINDLAFRLQHESV